MNQIATAMLREEAYRKGWGHKIPLYAQNLVSVNTRSPQAHPTISLIVISWRFHPDTLKNFEILNQQRHENFELIFVNNGGSESEFAPLVPYADTIVRLGSNTGAYLARNIGALFARAPVLFFLEDDGIPDRSIVHAHLVQYARYDIHAIRGACFPKTQNPLNALAGHLYPGSRPFPRFGDLEGNISYRAPIFYKAQGWDDNLKFGHGAIDLSFRMLAIDPEKRRQIYSPDPVIYHDYARNEAHLIEKRDKQKQAWDYLHHKNGPAFPGYLKTWDDYRDREDLLIPLGIPGDSGPSDADQAEIEKNRHLVAANDILESLHRIPGRDNQIQMIKQAINEMEIALALDPDDSRLLNNIETLCRKIGEHRPCSEALRPASIQEAPLRKTIPAESFEQKRENALSMLHHGEYDPLLARYSGETVFPFTHIISAALLRSRRYDEALHYLNTLPNDEEAILKRFTVDALKTMDAYPLEPEPRVHVILLTHNREQYVAEALRQLAATDYRNYAVYIADNGSADNTWQIVQDNLSAFPPYVEVHAESLPMNIGRPIGHNWLLEKYDHTASEFIAIADDDLMHIPPDWLRNMVNTARLFPDAIGVGPKALNPEFPHLIHGGVRNLKTFTDTEIVLTNEDDTLDYGQFDYIRPTDHVIACLQIYRTRPLFDDVGLFDIRLSPCQYVDIEHHLRCRLKGYRLVYNGMVRVVHYRAMGKRAAKDPAMTGNSIGNMKKIIYKYYDSNIPAFIDTETQRFSQWLESVSRISL